MKNIFKFTPTKEIEPFKIKESSSTPTYSKEISINSKLNENIELLKELLHYPLSNDIQFRFFDIHINGQSYSSLLIFYDGLVDSDLINDYILKQAMQDFTVPTKQESIIKNKQILDLKAIIAGSILAECQVNFAEKYH